MFFFIIWGNKVKQEEAGCVGDKCPSCHAIRSFRVIRIRKVPHVYYISLGSGTVVAVARKCSKCQSEYICSEQQYERVLPLEHMGVMSSMELARRTNPRVVEEAEQMESLKQMALGQAASAPAAAGEAADATKPQMPDPEFLALYESLRDYQEEPTAAALLKQLGAWSSLAAEARIMLRRDTDAFLEEKRKNAVIMTFIHQMSAKAPFAWWQLLCGLGVPAFLIGGLVLAAVANIRNPAPIAWGGAALALLSGLAVLPLNHWFRKRWVQQTLLPQAQAEQIDLLRLTTYLEVFSRHANLKPAIARLASHHRPLRRAMEEGNKA